MFIKELDIAGFKSFASRTRVQFDASITAVVGPNGCGKSNILDAIKWVLGEKSVKSIRGEKMEDVIFSGTANHAAANAAEVHLLLDNHSRILPIDQDEIKVGRRLYRDGQSQYLLGESRVPRKEIEKLLMDTGLGKTSYSFMEQGRMDMILSSKPEDRRIVFEEAAGISRFKAQREDAQRDLENTQLNLTRVQDILAELERELQLKEGQAEKTQKYNELVEKRKQHDLKIRYLTLQETNKNLSDLDEKMSRKKAGQEKHQQKVYQLEEKIEATSTELEEDRRQLHEKDVANQVSREKITQWEKSISESRERRAALEEEKNGLADQMETIDKRVKGIKGEIANQNQFTLQLKGQLEDAERALKRHDSEIEKYEKQIYESQTRIKEWRQKETENREALQDLRKKQEEVIQDLLESLKQEKQVWEQTESDREERRAAVISKLNAFVKELEDEAKSKEITSDSIQEKLKHLEPQKLLQDIDELSQLNESLRHLLFEKGGIHSQKEELDETIAATEKENEELAQRQANRQQELEEAIEEKNRLVRTRESLLGDIKSFQVQQDNVIEKEKTLNEQLEHEEASLQFLRTQYQRVEKEMLSVDSQVQSSEDEIRHLKAGIQKELKRIENLEKHMQQLEKKKSDLQAQVHKEHQRLNEVHSEINELEVKIGTLLGSKEAIIQDIYNDYNLTVEELENYWSEEKIQLEAEKNRLSEVQREIESLGPINSLAIEELQTIRELYEHNKSQLNDIQEARKDILQVIEDIRKNSEKMFLESFEKIQENFRYVFRKLFDGGEVELSLQDANDPLQSGIEIQVQPPGKKARSLKLLSGGEKALTAISLMFGIYMVRSSPFCVLDEIDAPLDDQNVRRFLDLLDEFVQDSQFILITHHKKTMSKANAIFGVTMEEPGVSRLLGVELRNEHTQKEDAFTYG